MSLEFKVGDCVIVKQGIKEPDYEEFEIGGWQGRIVDIDISSDENNTLITIEWDSITLKKIPSSYIVSSEEEGYDWKQMILFDSNVVKAVPKDTESNVKETQNKLSDDYYWVSFGEVGFKIMEVLKGVDPKNEIKCLEKWVNYLEKELSFPVHVKVVESEDNWIVKEGEHALIKSLPHIVDMYGIIASIKLEKTRKIYEFPLCNLEASDIKNENFQLIDNYRVWFDNR